jgi:CRISPR-associated endoribonuclease Cas6
MIFNLTLFTHEKEAVLPINYQYQVSCAIFRIIESSSPELSAFLHGNGYQDGCKRFKLFTFSDIRAAPFKIVGDRIFLLGNTISLTVCFYVPETAEHFLRGLFTAKQFSIADRKSGATFHIQQIESIIPSLPVSADIITVIMQPISPLVSGYKTRDMKHYQYRAPHDPDFTECLLKGWLEKYRIVHQIPDDMLQQAREQVKVNTLFFDHEPQQRLVTIKDLQTHGYTESIRGYTKFRLQATAPKKMIELALNAGLGLHNTQGFGCMKLINQKNNEGRKDRNRMVNQVNR